MDRRWIVAGVGLAAIAVGLTVLWPRTPLGPERLEGKLATQLCRRLAECEPERFDTEFHRDFDDCIGTFQPGLAPLAACATADGAGRACIRAVRDAACGTSWSVERVRVACPALTDCP